MVGFLPLKGFLLGKPIQIDMCTVQTGRFPPKVLAPARIHSVYTESSLIEGIEAVNVVQPDVFIRKKQFVSSNSRSVCVELPDHLSSTAFSVFTPQLCLVSFELFALNVCIYPPPPTKVAPVF